MATKGRQEGDTNLSLHIGGMSLSPCVTQGTRLWGEPKADPTKVTLSSSPSDRCKLACLLWRCRGGHECGESLLVHLAEKDHWDSFSSELWNIQPCLWQHVLQGVSPRQWSPAILHNKMDPWQGESRKHGRLHSSCQHIKGFWKSYNKEMYLTYFNLLFLKCFWP